MTTREGVFWSGDFFLLCDICGMKRRRSECVKDFDSRMVCADTCLDVENPIEHLRGSPARQAPQDAQYNAPVTAEQTGGWVEREWVEPDWVQ